MTIFRFSFKTVNKNKSNYKGCCLCSSKGFLTPVKTLFAYLIAPVIPAASKPLIMESFCFLRSNSVLLAWGGYKSHTWRDTFTSSFAIPFAHCISIPCVEFVVNEFFCCLIKLISKGWNLLLRFWEAVISSQLFFVLRGFISLFSWPLNVSMIIREHAALAGSQDPSFFLTNKERW